MQVMMEIYSLQVSNALPADLPLAQPSTCLTPSYRLDRRLGNIRAPISEALEEVADDLRIRLKLTSTPRFAPRVKNLLMPLFLMGCFPVNFQEVKRPLKTKSGKRPTKVGKWHIEEGKRPWCWLAFQSAA